MTLQEAKKLINPSTLHFGVVKNGDKMPFTIVNSTGIPIKGYSKSCGCVGTVSHDADSVWGNIEAVYKKDRVESIYLVDGVYCLQVPSTDKVRYLGIVEKSFIENPQEIKEVMATKFDQQLTVKLDDGRPSEIRKDDGEIVYNQEQLNVVVPITFYVVA